jgi:protein SCO1/2
VRRAIDRVAAVVGLVLLLVRPLGAVDRYAATGMVLEVDTARKTFIASIDPIKGYMAAMTMPFQVKNVDELAGLVPGAIISFTLVVDKSSSFVEGVRIQRIQNVEQDPLAARRLTLLREIAAGGTTSKAVAIGAAVPDFTLTDQKNRNVKLSQFRGQVVAVNFMYTTCQLPDFCVRMVNHFSVLQKVFRTELGRDLAFLTISFDPTRDTPEVLDHYANQWKANPETWHFLTGSGVDVQRVLERFGVVAYPDEGLMDHSLHTVLIDRQGRLFANVEGNKFSTDQLADLVRAALKPATPKSPSPISR